MPTTLVFLKSLRMIIPCIAVTFLMVPLAGDAATVYIETPQASYAPRTIFPIHILLNTEDEIMNAVEGMVNVTGGETVNISEGRSAVSLWVRSPAANENGSVPFAGIIPGGRLGNRLPLFTLFVRAMEATDITIHIQDTRALLNDGAGTERSIADSSHTISVAESALPFEDTEPFDLDPPDVFTPIRMKDPLLADGKHVVVFVAHDKGSGISHYEVFETPREITRERDVQWERAESPYVLRDQTRGNFVYLKAVDRVGNERIVRVNPARERAWHEEPETENAIVWGVGFIIILGYTLFRYPWRKRGSPFYFNG